MKKIIAIVASVIVVAMFALTGCEAVQENTSEGSDATYRVVTGVTAEELDLTDNQVALYFGNNEFWVVDCYDNYMDSLDNPITVASDDLEYIVFTPKDRYDNPGRMIDSGSSQWGYETAEEALDNTYSKTYLQYQHSEYNPDYWTSSDARTTYRFEQKEADDMYYYMTFAPEKR